MVRDPTAAAGSLLRRSGTPQPAQTGDGATQVAEHAAAGGAQRRWRSTDGPLAGERLPQVRHDQQFWFALAAFLPDARILE